ncbi:hypothetical protein Q8F55_007326 [Vanrija albida]|uniref:Zn(2)-C6 fungal-type domain-containing protein n=1 Tax=Vanrija albida TaxID=181172 RepID=A0ABR3PZL0_9TREE
MDRSSDPYAPRFRRTRTGCLCCRRSRHKCDEEKPSCRRCTRQSRPCVYPGSSPQQAAFFNAVPSELPPVDTLALIYPDVEERSLMSHFLCFGANRSSSNPTDNLAL